MNEARKLLEDLARTHLALLNACLTADATGDLSEYVDGDILDQSARAQEAAEKFLYPLGRISEEVSKEKE